MNRNPYFFGVDSAGNQLPYFDQITHRLFSDTPTSSTCGSPTVKSTSRRRHVSAAAADYTLYKGTKPRATTRSSRASAPATWPSSSTWRPRTTSCASSSMTAMCASPCRCHQPRPRSTNWSTPAWAPRASTARSRSRRSTTRSCPTPTSSIDLAEANKLLDAAGYKQGCRWLPQVTKMAAPRSPSPSKAPITSALRRKMPTSRS